MLRNPKEFEKLLESNAKHNEREENVFDESDSDNDDTGPIVGKHQLKGTSAIGSKITKKQLTSLEDKESEESTEKLDLKRILTAYITSARFSPFLKKIGYNTAYIKKMDKFDVEKLKIEIYKIKFIIRNRNSQKFYEEMVFGLVYLVEQMSRGRLAGLTQLCRVDDSFLDSIEEIRIETAGVFMIQSSKIHGAIVFLTKAFQTYALNKAIQAMPPSLTSQPIPTMPLTADTTQEQPVQTYFKPNKTQPRDEMKRNKKETDLSSVTDLAPNKVSLSPFQIELDYDAIAALN